MVPALKFFIGCMGIKEGDIEANFRTRFEIQKRIRLLQTHPQICKYIDYDFNLYLRGPYSPSLAEDYYSLEGEPVELAPITDNARAFVDFVRAIPTNDLELFATVVQVLSYSANRPADSIVRQVKSLKPKFDEAQIHSALRAVRGMKEEFGLSI